MHETDQVHPQGNKSLPASAPSNGPSATRVLAVDDEPAAAKLLAVILAPPAFRCTTANTAEEALVALQREPFDAVISDLQMPGLSGIELLTEVRRNHPHVAFLVTTVVDDVDVGVKAMRSGADDYLVKPLRETAVIASLENALHKRRLQQEVEHYQQHLEEMVAGRTQQLQAALRHVEQSYEDTLQSLGAAIDLRDNETAGHSQRVCRYSLEIARAMGWRGKEIGSLARGAYLHDIGKLGVPDGVLLKPGPLTGEERRVMQQHSQIGFDLIKDIPFLADAAEIVLMHHERFDGTGYPRGLRGGEILLGARIFAIADTLDAMTSERPYQRATSFESARETIRRLSGTSFDPQVVSIFLNLHENIWPTIARNQRQIAGLSPELRRNPAMLHLGLSFIP
jgi:response regulator RpfG family c-di-GMP phosphodiesterase